MAAKKRKEPKVVLAVFLVLLVGIIVLFALRGNLEYLETLDRTQLAMMAAILAVIYILYVELRGKRMGQTLVEEKIKTHTLVEALPQAVMVVDDENRVVTANDEACRRLSLDPVGCVGADLSAVFDGATTDRVSTGGAGKIDGRSKDGSTMRVTVAPMRGGAGRLVILEEAAKPAAAAAPDRPVPAVWDALTPLDGFLDRMEADARRAIGSALIRARKLMNRVADLESLPARANKRPTDIAGVVREAGEKAGPIARAKGIALDVQANGDCSAGADSEMLRRAIEEILVNSCTYAPEGSAVKVEVLGGGNEVNVRVTDAGVGIPSAEFSKIFEPGFVGSNQVPDGRDGGGLGLALARRVVESHGGSIWVESETGRGTRISLTIPRN